MKTLNAGTLMVCLFAAQVAWAAQTASDTVPVASCTVGGQEIILSKVQSDPNEWPSYEADVIPASGTGYDRIPALRAIAHVDPGYGMDFYRLSLVRHGSVVASTTAWIPQPLGNQGDDRAFVRFSTLSLTAQDSGESIACSFHIGQVPPNSPTAR